MCILHLRPMYHRGTMPVPPYKLFIDPVLRYLAGLSSPATAGDVCEAVASALQLSDDDRREQLRSGGAVYKNRAGWAFNWLKRAELARAANPGEWQLTNAGRQLAAANPTLTEELLATFAARVEARSLDVPMNRSTGASTRSQAAVGDRKAYRLPPRPMATGGQAELYEAVRKVDGHVLVFKRIRDSFTANSMRREIEVQSALKHLNIMPILDWDHSRFTWYVMPRGSRVMSELVRPVEQDLLCRVVGSVAAALSFAHAAGHPHRDVKPQNIIELTEDSGETHWVLADWGLTRRAPGQTTARWTKTGQFLGTEGFAPPEAYRDAHNVGVPGDVYALGQVIAWATGVDPIPNVPSTAVPPWSALVECMTQQDARMRPQSMTEVQRLLSAL